MTPQHKGKSAIGCQTNGTYIKTNKNEKTNLIITHMV